MPINLVLKRVRLNSDDRLAEYSGSSQSTSPFSTCYRLGSSKGASPGACEIDNVDGGKVRNVGMGMDYPIHIAQDRD